MKETILHYKEKLDRKLFIRQIIFIIIILALLAISTLNVWEKKITFTLAVSGFLLSTIIGLMLSRMFKIFWHQEKGKVVSQLDAMGGVLLAVYLIIELSRHWLFERWLSGAALNAFGLIVLGGLLFGRFLGMMFLIKTAISENEESII